MTYLKNATIFHAIEKWAPKHIAYDWDNVGLQVGSYQNEAKKVMITLDVTESVVDEALNKNVELIVAQNRLLNKTLKHIESKQPTGSKVQQLTQNNITVYASHTNSDTAYNGVKGMLCHALVIT